MQRTYSTTITEDDEQWRVERGGEGEKKYLRGGKGVECSMNTQKKKVSFTI